MIKRKSWAKAIEADDPFHYDYGRVDTDPEGYDEEERNEWEDDEWERPRKKLGGRLLTTIQIMVCSIALLIAVFLKLFGGPAYEAVREWYLTNLNNSIIAKERLEDIKQTCLRLVPSSESQEAETKNGAFAVSSSEASKAPSIPESNALFTNSLNSGIPVTMTAYLSPPLESGTVTSSFGERGEKSHQGVDIGADLGTPIGAALPGVVEEAGQSPSYGNYIVLDHGNGIRTLYAHCSKLLAKEGDSVACGQEIAEVGSTGDSSGPHLHFELTINEVHYNPEPMLKIQY